MKRQIIWILPLLLCFCLILAACGAGSAPVDNTGGNNTGNSAQENSEGPSDPSNTNASEATDPTDPSGTNTVETTNISETNTADSSDPSNTNTAENDPSEDPLSGTPIVYFTSDITAEGLVNVYKALNWTPTGKVGVKISTGEPPASNYLKPELIGDLVKLLDANIVECMTAYGVSRSSVAMHKQVAIDHGFTAIADFDLLDEEGDIELPVPDYPGARITAHIVGSHYTDYGSFVILSHFKGHQMAGYGGAIKNISIGFGSKTGKTYIHSGGETKTGSPWGGEQDAFLEAMAEAGLAVQHSMGDGERIVYINVMNRLSIDCDCNGNPAEPDIHDIGILASYDPVALDQACLDLIYHAEGKESFVQRVESKNGFHTLEHAEEIGLGSRTYQLVDIDE